MSAHDLRSQPPRASPPRSPGDQATPRADTPPAFAVPIENSPSGVPARMASLIRSAVTTAVPAWKLTTLGLAVVGVYLFFGPAPASLVLAALLLAEATLGVVRRARFAKGTQ